MLFSNDVCSCFRSKEIGTRSSSSRDVIMRGEWNKSALISLSFDGSLLSLDGCPRRGGALKHMVESEMKFETICLFTF